MPSAEDLALSVLGVSDWLGVDGLDDGTVGGGVCAGAGCVAKGVAATGVAAALADDWLAANWHDCCAAGWIYLKEKKIYFVLHWSEQKNWESFSFLPDTLFLHFVYQDHQDIEGNNFEWLKVKRFFF